MKKSLVVIRWIVGLLFIFSGLIKANDPLGLSYKMQEFFEVWGLSSLNGFTLSLSLVMNVFEVLAGVAVIIGWRMRLFSWLLLLLIIFFCFLTAYAYLSGNIKTCGCFGDCIPLTPLTSFIKDLLLLLLILVLFFNWKKIKPAVAAPLPQVLLIICVSSTIYLQYYVMNHLPLKDCLPFKKGANIIESMKVPAGAPADSIVLTFKYKKNGQLMEFDANSFPADFDSTYEFVERYQKTVKKGFEPAIVDFSLQSLKGNDITVSVLNQGNYYVMLLVNDFSNSQKWRNKDFDSLEAKLAAKHLPLFIVTSEKDKAVEFFGTNNKNIRILIGDGTVIKTAARVNPTYFVMQLANIKDKYSYQDINMVMEAINAAPVNEYYDDFDIQFDTGQ